MSDDANRAVRRRQIMAAVVDLTASGGLESATFRTIADKAGVSVRLVQYYFGTKDELLAATLAYVGTGVAERVRMALERLGPQPAPRDVMTTICEEFLPLDEERRRAMLVFIAFRTAALTDPTLASSDRLGLGQSLIATFEEQIRRAVDGSGHGPGYDPHSEAVLLVAALAGLSNEILAQTMTVTRARHHLAYALDRTLAR